MAADVTNERAEAALRMVLSDTAEAQRLAADVLAQPNVTVKAQMLATFALGRCHVELGEPAAALPLLEQARTLAAELGDDERRSLISSRLAVALFENGQAEAALQALEEATIVGSESARGTALNAQGMILSHGGQLHAAKASFDASVVLLESSGDEDMQVRARSSRSAVEARLGDFVAAEADLARSTELAESLGMAAIVAGNLHNLGYIRSQRGMVPEALDTYQEARTGYELAGAPARAVAILDTDLAETLLAAGLHDEALEAAERTLNAARGGKHAVQEAESELLRARILLAAQRLADCSEAADNAVKLFEETERRPWAAQARYLRLQAQTETAPDLDEMRRIVTELEAHGWTGEALHLLTVLSRSLIDDGDNAGAAEALKEAESMPHKGQATQRASLWHARARLRIAEGDRRGAQRALNSGLRLLDEHRAALGATELRVRAAGHAVGLAELGLTLALEARRPTDALRWNERGRALALRVPPARPPRDDDLAQELSLLRSLHTDARAAQLTGQDVTAFDGRIAEAERRVREHARLARGGGSETVGLLDSRALRERLLERTLVEFFEVGGRIGAVRMNRKRATIHDVGSAEHANSILDGLNFSLRRLAARQGSQVSLEAAAEGLGRSAADLDGLLGETLAGDEEAVIVPSSSLQATPWQLLPSLCRRPVTVAPSAVIWMRPPSERSGATTAHFIAGPGLPAAVEEARKLRGLYPDSDVLLGPHATASASLEAAASTRLLHVAAHGTFRADSPMFSALHLADGPLTIYDIERLESVPHTVVLSACHAGVSEASVGNEVIGTAMALVGVGVRTVVAPLVAIADDATAEAMVAMHRRMLDGDSPQRALAHLVGEWTTSDPAMAATAAAFVVIGADTR